MAKDGTNRGGRRVRAGDKPKPLAEKIAAGEDADIIEFTPTMLEGAELDDAADLVGEEMPSPSEYLSAFKCMANHLEKGGAAYVFHADTEGLNFHRAFIDAGFHLANCYIRVKDSLVLGRSDYQWQHEPVLYGFMQNGKHKWYSDRKQTTLWNFDKPKRNANHPTSNPLYLLGYPIGNSTQENGVVIDTFGGSGSTLMACEQMNRICCMMELDEKYASVILKRYVEDTGDSEDVYVIRNGQQIPYSELVKEAETKEG